MTTDDRTAWRSMARLTTVADVATARVVAARLEFEGIDSQIRGEALGPYPIAVGSWGATEIWVAEADLADAHAVLEEITQDAAQIDVETAGIGKSPSLLRSVVWWVVAALLLAWLIYLRIGRFL